LFATCRLDLARQQNFVDQPVELGDVALQVGGVIEPIGITEDPLENRTQRFQLGSVRGRNCPITPSH
jgi:hypothetical protein